MAGNHKIDQPTPLDISQKNKQFYYMSIDSCVGQNKDKVLERNTFVERDQKNQESLPFSTQRRKQNKSPSEFDRLNNPILLNRLLFESSVSELVSFLHSLEPLLLKNEEGMFHPFQDTSFRSSYTSSFLVSGKKVKKPITSNEAMATLPYSGRQVSIKKSLSGHFSCRDLNSGAELDYLKELDNELLQYTKEYGKKAPNLAILLSSVPSNIKVDVRVYINIKSPSLQEILLDVDFPLGRFPKLSSAQLQQYYKESSRIVEKNYNKFVNTLLELGVKGAFPEEYRTQLSLNLSSHEIEIIESCREVVFISKNEEINADSFSRYPHYGIPFQPPRLDLLKRLPEEFYHGSNVGIGFYNNQGFRGRGVTMLVLESALPDLNDSCFWTVDQYPLLGSSPKQCLSLLPTRLLKTQNNPRKCFSLEDYNKEVKRICEFSQRKFRGETSDCKNSHTQGSAEFYQKDVDHATAVTSIIKQNPEYYSPLAVGSQQRAKDVCPTVGSDGTGLYGGAREVKLLVASTQLGSVASYLPRAIEIAQSENNALVINFSGKQASLGSSGPFNGGVVDLDQRAEQLLNVMAAGNQTPTSWGNMLENAPFNGISVRELTGGFLSPSVADAKDTIYEKFYLVGDLVKPDVAAFSFDPFRFLPSLLNPEPSVTPSAGSSFSAPKVASLAALLFEHLEQTGINPQLHPEIIKAVILATAVTMTSRKRLPCTLNPPGGGGLFGAGVVNAEAAFKLVQKFSQFVQDHGERISFHESLGFVEVDTENDFLQIGDYFQYTWPGGQPVFLAQKGQTIRAVLCSTIIPGEPITDFDLILEKLNPSLSLAQGKPVWQVDASSLLFDSNTEMLTADIENSGIFRLAIIYWTTYKYSKGRPFQAGKKRLAWSVFLAPTKSIPTESSQVNLKFGRVKDRLPSQKYRTFDGFPLVTDTAWLYRERQRKSNRKA